MAGGKLAVDELAGLVPSAASAPRYAQIVRDLAMTRRVLNATYDVQAIIAERRHDGEELLEHAERLMFALRREQRGIHVTLEEAVTSELERLREVAHSGRTISGTPTGFTRLDALTGGLHDGTMIVIAARPGMGKSAVALNIGLHVALKQQRRVVFGALEMSQAETAQRYLAQTALIDGERLHHGQLRDEDFPALLRAAAASAGAPFHVIDDGAMSVADLRARTQHIAVRHGRVDLLIVDYLQLMRVEKPSGNRTTDVGEISRGLKVLSRELGCPVLAISQLSREVERRPDKRPILADLRDSGTIEQDADNVWMLYRDEYYDPDSDRPGTVDVLVRKARQGRCGEIELGWSGRFLRATERTVDA